MPKILLIDDDAEMRSALEQTLTLAGHNVLLAEDGEQGLVQVEEELQAKPGASPKGQG